MGYSGKNVKLAILHSAGPDVSPLCEEIALKVNEARRQGFYSDDGGFALHFNMLPTLHISNGLSRDIRDNHELWEAVGDRVRDVYQEGNNRIAVCFPEGRVLESLSFTFSIGKGGLEIASSIKADLNVDGTMTAKPIPEIINTVKRIVENFDREEIKRSEERFKLWLSTKEELLGLFDTLANEFRALCRKGKSFQMKYRFDGIPLQTMYRWDRYGVPKTLTVARSGGWEITLETEDGYQFVVKRKDILQAYAMGWMIPV